MTTSTALLSKALHDYVIPALSLLPANLNTLNRRQIVLGTGWKESGYTHVRQIGGGPALGFWQMEPDTHDDIWKNYLSHRPDLKAAAETAAGQPDPIAELLVVNPIYSAIMCAIQYRRSPILLPVAFDAFGQACMWKKAYNGPGAGVVSEAVQYFREANEIS